LNRESAGHHGTRGCERIELAGAYVRRAAHDVEQRARAHVDAGEVQMIRVGVRRFLDDARDDERREVLPQRDQLVDRRDVGGDQLAQVRRRLLERNERLEPLVRDVHSAIRSRKRTSES
jgi:hypothetical protein